MIVEDDDDIAGLITYHLESAGFRVQRPTLPSRLIANAERERPLLFILDLMLPELDGFDLCRRIRAHPNLRDIPILVLTAKTAPVDRKRALESGADIYVTKPFIPSELVRSVWVLLGENTFGSRHLDR
jgi:two-component system phosphate regulon response regulator PhoB